MVTGGIRTMQPEAWRRPSRSSRKCLSGGFLGENDAEMLGTCDVNKSEFGLCGIPLSYLKNHPYILNNLRWIPLSYFSINLKNHHLKLLRKPS